MTNSLQDTHDMVIVHPSTLFVPEHNARSAYDILHPSKASSSANVGMQDHIYMGGGPPKYHQTPRTDSLDNLLFVNFPFDWRHSCLICTFMRNPSSESPIDRRLHIGQAKNCSCFIGITYLRYALLVSKVGQSLME
jgi:hypothetical protein